MRSVKQGAMLVMATFYLLPLVLVCFGILSLGVAAIVGLFVWIGFLAVLLLFPYARDLLLKKGSEGLGYKKEVVSALLIAVILLLVISVIEGLI